MSTFVDKTITCIDCKQPFVFAAGEQEFFSKKTTEDGKPWSEPRRCKACRARKRAERETKG